MAIKDLFEELGKTFYSGKEAKIEIGQQKNLSQSTPIGMIGETDVINTDFSNSFTIGGQVDYILAQRNVLIKQWRKAVYQPEVSDAIQEIVNEAMVFSDSKAIPFELQLDDVETTDKVKEQIQDSFDKILKLLDFNKRGYDIFEQWYTDGVLNLEVVYDNKKVKEGIKKVIMLSPFSFFKKKNVTTGESEFFYNTQMAAASSSQSFNLGQMHQEAEIKYKPEQITQVGSGVTSEDKLFSVSHLNKAMKVLNQLQLIEDSVIIYRITRAPEKKVFYIDVGRAGKAKAEQYIQGMMNKYRNKLTYNIETGEVDNRKNAISVQEDYWLPRTADGKGTEVEQLQGTGADLGELADIEYFQSKLFRALNVPDSRGSKGNESQTQLVTGNQFDVEKQELKFFKFVVRLRKKFNEVFMDLMKKELISTKVLKLSEWNVLKESIFIKYVNNNEFAEAKKLMNLSSKMDIASTATSLVDEGLVSKQWILETILGFNEEEIKKIKKEREKEAAEEPQEDDEE